MQLFQFLLLSGRIVHIYLVQYFVVNKLEFTGDRMAISNIKTTVKAKLQDVWDVVASLENYQWRSDIKVIEVISEKQFAEITKDGYTTTFTITRTEPYVRWEFDLENDNMRGYWIGLFYAKGDVTEIDFTEVVTAKKLIMKPFVKGYLKKQQKRYISDLKMAVEG